MVANDEQGSASTGVPPDPGYPGFTGKDNQGNDVQSLHEVMVGEVTLALEPSELRDLYAELLARAAA